MLKWTGEREGRPVIGLGLEEKNLEKLREGKPVYVRAEDLGIRWDIVIYYGKDMEALLAMTQPGVGPETIVHDTRRRPD